MSTRTPGIQQRSQYQSYWGRFIWNTAGVLPSFGGRTADPGSQGLPNAPNNIISAAEYVKLEAGDIAATASFSVPTGTEYGLWTCIFPGTSGGGDAVWVRCDNTSSGGAIQTIRDAHVIVVAQQGGGFTPTTGVPVTDTLLNLNPQVAGIAADFIDTGDGAGLAAALTAATALSAATPCDVRLRPCDIDLASGAVLGPLAIPQNTSLIGASATESTITGRVAVGQNQGVFTMAVGSSLERMRVISPAPTGGPIGSGGIVQVLDAGCRVIDCQINMETTALVARTTLFGVDTSTGANAGNAFVVRGTRFLCEGPNHASTFATDTAAINTQGATDLGATIQGVTIDGHNVGLRLGAAANSGDIQASQVSMVVSRAGVALAANNLAIAGLRFTDVRISFTLVGVTGTPQTGYEINTTNAAGEVNQVSIMGSTVAWLALTTVSNRNFIRCNGAVGSVGVNGVKMVACGVEGKATNAQATDGIFLTNVVRGGDILCDWDNVFNAEVFVSAGTPTWEHAHSV